jgi:hypothetical protein
VDNGYANDNSILHFYSNLEMIGVVAAQIVHFIVGIFPAKN